MLGILVGITAVVLTVGIGQGSSATVRDQINELGTNLLVVSPGSSTSSVGVRGGFGTVTTLTQADAAALTSKVTAPDVAAVSPVSTTSAELVNPTTGANWTTTLTGTSPTWETTRSRGAQLGRFITAKDERNAAPVVVLGPVTVTQLFGSTNPIGSYVTYNGVKLQVVGVLQNFSSAEQAASNDLAVVPLSTYGQRLVGGTSRNSVSLDLREGGLRRHALRGVPRDQRVCCSTPTTSRVRATPTSRSPPSSRSSPRPTRSTTR